MSRSKGTNRRGERGPRASRSVYLAAGNCLLVLIFVLVWPDRAHSQAPAPYSPGAMTEEEDLAEKVNDPTAILTQFKLQDLYTPRNFQSTAQTNALQLRAVLPVSRFWLLPDQVIRPTFTIDTLATGRSSQTITELGDTQLF